MQKDSNPVAGCQQRGNGFIPTISRSLDRFALVCTLGASSTALPRMHGQCWVLLDGIRMGEVIRALKVLTMRMQIYKYRDLFAFY